MNLAKHTKSQDELKIGFADPRAFGLVKAAYTVSETLNLLSIGRTSLYAAVKQGQLHPVKFGRKTLLYATDLAAFLKMLKEQSS
jgi:excisionase family DNA binding protein